MQTITIEGQLRTEIGKQATRQLRSEEKVPGVIYGGAKEVNFSAPATAFKTLVYTPDFQLAEVKVGGNSYRCILKDLQFDKVTDDLIHVDLLELVEDKKVIATIPIKFTGAPKGVKDGGKLIVSGQRSGKRNPFSFEPGAAVPEVEQYRLGQAEPQRQLRQEEYDQGYVGRPADNAKE